MTQATSVMAVPGSRDASQLSFSNNTSQSLMSHHMSRLQALLVLTLAALSGFWTAALVVPTTSAASVSVVAGVLLLVSSPLGEACSLSITRTGSHTRVV